MKPYLKTPTVTRFGKIMFIIGAVSMLNACDYKMTGKNMCYEQEDCLEGRFCQIEEGETLGHCVSTEDIKKRKPCSECTVGEVCYENQCHEKCDDINDCAQTEICSLLELSPDEFGTACISEDICFSDEECPIGESGSLCSRTIYNSRPAGCLKQWCNVNLSTRCPTGWECIEIFDINSASKSEYDPYFEYGKCTNGEVGAPCDEDDHCNGEDLECDIFNNRCVYISD